MSGAARGSPRRAVRGAGRGGASAQPLARGLADRPAVGTPCRPNRDHARVTVAASLASGPDVLCVKLGYNIIREPQSRLHADGIPALRPPLVAQMLKEAKTRAEARSARHAHARRKSEVPLRNQDFVLAATVAAKGSFCGKPLAAFGTNVRQRKGVVGFNL